MALSVPELSDVDVAFPADPPLPDWRGLPDDLRRRPFSGKWPEIAGAIFTKGAAVNGDQVVVETLSSGRITLTPKPGIDGRKAMRAAHACLSSFQPQHEHKIAGVAFMLSEWFDAA